jgi:hypothetical protein
MKSLDVSSDVSTFNSEALLTVIVVVKMASEKLKRQNQTFSRLSYCKTIIKNIRPEIFLFYCLTMCKITAARSPI